MAASSRRYRANSLPAASRRPAPGATIGAEAVNQHQQGEETGQLMAGVQIASNGAEITAPPAPTMPCNRRAISSWSMVGIAHTTAKRLAAGCGDSSSGAYGPNLSL